MLKLALLITLLLSFPLYAAESDERSNAEEFLEFYCTAYECEYDGNYGQPVPDENTPVDPYYILYGTDKQEVDDYIRDGE